MDKKIFLAIIAAFILPSLAACGGTAKDDIAYSAPDMFATPVDPDDGLLREAIQKYLAEQKGPTNSQYEYVRRDLNGDGLREGLVLFNLPHSYWCGWSGCTMAVFQARDNTFTLLSQTSRIRGPLHVGGSQTNGWEDIGVRITGTDRADRSVLLKFDGDAYPANPQMMDDSPYDLASLGAARIFP